MRCVLLWLVCWLCILDIVHLGIDYWLSYMCYVLFDMCCGLLRVVCVACGVVAYSLLVIGLLSVVHC